MSPFKKGDKMSNKLNPKIHCAPNFGYMGDPNGFSFYNGEYHLFYQHNPHGYEWADISWGHSVSKDLVKWHQQPVAICPGEQYDDAGCWSGTALSDKDGTLKMMYTGISEWGKYPDAPWRSQQALVVYDGKTFKKALQNPVICDAELPDEFLKFDFRDPYLITYGEYYYCLIGTRHIPAGGNIVTYRSKDLIKWEYVGKALDVDVGMIVECPSLIQTDRWDYLVVSVPALRDEGFTTRNSNVYFKGKFDFETGRFTCDGIPKLLDFGFDFYAAQTIPKDGKTYIVGMMWMQGRKCVTESQAREEHWQSFVREIVVDDNGELRQIPVCIPEEYFGKSVSAEIKENACLNLFDTYIADVNIVMEEDGNTQFVFADKFKVEFSKGGICIDNSACAQALGYEENGEKAVRFIPANISKINVKIIVDAYSVELFVNDGKWPITTLINEKSPRKLDVKVKNSNIKLEVKEIV